MRRANKHTPKTTSDEQNADQYLKRIGDLNNYAARAIIWVAEVPNTMSEEFVKSSDIVLGMPSSGIVAVAAARACISLKP